MSFKLECIPLHTGFGLLGDVSIIEFYNSSLCQIWRGMDSCGFSEYEGVGLIIVGSNVAP